MENTTINTFLYYSSTKTGTFNKLVDITSYPELFSAPEKLDISNMSSKQKKYAPGMVDVPDNEFGYIYNKTDYQKIKALEGSDTYFQLRFGANGEYGAWGWHGDVFTSFSPGSVGSAREAKLLTYPVDDIEEVTITPPSSGT